VARRVSHARSAIAVAPQIFPFTFGDEPVNSGEAISATCSILKGDFPMDIAWAFNGEPISAENTDQFSITKSKRLSVLSIDAVAARYAGEYTCTASNKAGASSRSAMLAVNGNTRACITHTTVSYRCLYSLSDKDKASLLFIILFSPPHSRAHDLFNTLARFVERGSMRIASACRLA
jgi:hypothetical protein